MDARAELQLAVDALSRAMVLCRYSLIAWVLEAWGPYVLGERVGVDWVKAELTKLANVC